MSISRVCVIGSGLSGLITLKALVSEESFKTITCYESRDRDGGIWNYSTDTGSPAPVPSVDPNVAFDSTVSPLYIHLETNVPYYNMEFNCHSFLENDNTEGHALYSTYNEVGDYLRKFGAQFSSLISHNTVVTDVTKSGNEWIVTTESNTGKSQSAFDAVIVASGSFNAPFIPEYPGLTNWNSVDPHSILHSKHYRDPEMFRDKTVFIVGSEVSGKDIAEATSPIAKKVYVSVHSEEKLAELLANPPFPGVNWVGRVDSFDAETRSVKLEDKPCLPINNIDYIVFATGFIRSYPFLTSINKSGWPIITDGNRAHNMYNHLYYSPDPTLSIIGLPKYVQPFRAFETQAIHVAKFLAGRLDIPPLTERIAWEQSILSQVSNDKDFHNMKYPKDFQYFDGLSAEIDAARPSPSTLEPSRYDSTCHDERLNLFQIRTAYRKLRAEKGVIAKSVKELVERGYLIITPAEPSSV